MTETLQTACAGCGARLSASSRFCSVCGRPMAASVPATPDRAPWLVAGAALAGLLGLLLVTIARDSPPPPSGTLPGTAAPATGEAPPDLSTMTPRERFDRLYNRIMRGAQAGDEATVTRFTPMALLAYAQLDTIDADARYHAALLRAHTGDVDAAGALGDTVLAQNPGHLFGYVIQGTVARWRRDDQALRRAYAGFLEHYEAEMRANRAEYGEHGPSMDDFRRSALEARARTDSGS